MPSFMQAGVRYIAVVPARLASTRVSRKLLSLLRGQPLLWHTVSNVAKAELPETVLVATDNAALDEVVSCGLRTPAAHVNCIRTPVEGVRCGTHRVAHAIRTFIGEDLSGLDRTYVVNVQGDQPNVNPKHVDYVLKIASDLGGRAIGSPFVATLATPICSEEELHDPNVVKVVRNSQKKAMYFSRAPIPFSMEGSGAGAGTRTGEDGALETIGTFDKPFDRGLRHLGLYAMRADVLVNDIFPLEESTLEATERLEQLSWLYSGAQIHVETVSSASLSVDSPADLQRIQKARCPE